MEDHVSESWQQNALSLLDDDHKKLKALMAELDQTTSRAVKTRQELFHAMQRQLAIHEKIEEEVFYPALRDHKKAKEDILEAYEEHHAVNMLLDELSEVAVDDETWSPKFTVIMENIQHHIKEEEDVIFIHARAMLDESELMTLGNSMLTLKAEEESRTLDHAASLGSEQKAVDTFVG